MAHLLVLYSEWLDQDLVARIQTKSPPIIFSLASLVLEGTIANSSLFNIPSIMLIPDKYNTWSKCWFFAIVPCFALVLQVLLYFDAIKVKKKPPPKC